MNIQTRRAAGTAELLQSIADTGKGIPSEKLANLFDFNFTDKDTRIGVGMGLMSAYHIIQKHRGEIEVKSEVGKGTIVIISLPIT